MIAGHIHLQLRRGFAQHLATSGGGGFFCVVAVAAFGIGGRWCAVIQQPAQIGGIMPGNIHRFAPAGECVVMQAEFAGDNFARITIGQAQKTIQRTAAVIHICRNDFWHLQIIALPRLEFDYCANSPLAYCFAISGLLNLRGSNSRGCSRAVFAILSDFPPSRE